VYRIYADSEWHDLQPATHNLAIAQVVAAPFDSVIYHGCYVVSLSFHIFSFVIDADASNQRSLNDAA
jgi:hypothetical protein